MYASHLAITLAVQSRSPSVPAWVFTVGAMLLDIVGAVNFALGLAKIAPDPTAGPIGVRVITMDWDHSLLMASVWSSLFALGAWAFIRARGGSTSEVMKYAYAMGMTHWVLDALVHNADMSLYPGSPIKFGISLWSLSPWGSWILEVYFSALMTVIYFRNYNALGLSGSDLYGPLPLIIASQLTMLPNISVPNLLASLMPADGILKPNIRIASGLGLALATDLGPALILAGALEKVKVAAMKTKKKE